MWRQLLLFAGIFTTSVFAAAADRPTLHMGTISAEIPATMVQRAEPLAKYLTTRIGITIIPRPGPNHNAVINDLAKNITQIAYLTPVAYITAQEQTGLKTIATPLIDGEPFSHSVVVVRRDSPVHTLQELRGKKFALGDPRALLQPATLYQAGMTLDSFGQIAYLKHNDNVAKAVLNRDFDGGIMPQSHAALYPNLRVIHVSPPIPTNPIVARGDVPKEKVDALRAALLNLNPRLAQDRAILQSFDPACTGFTAVQDKDFDDVRKLMAPLMSEPKAGAPG